MKRIETSIDSCQVDAVKAALKKVGVTTMKITDVFDVGGETRSITYRGTTRKIDAIPKINIETIVPDRHENLVINAIVDAARIQSECDGFVVVSDVVSITRIRTGEIETTDEEPLQIQPAQAPAVAAASRWDVPSYQHSW